MEDVKIDSKLKEKFGEDVVKDLDQWVREIFQAETKDQYRQILSRLDILEDRYEGLSDEVYRLRGEMNGFRTDVNQRFDSMRSDMDQRFDSMKSDMDQRFGIIDQRLDAMRDNIDLRFDAMKGYIDHRFDAMNISIDQRFDVVNQRLDAINRQFEIIDQKFDVMNQRIISSMKWSVGTIGIFGLIITILITVFKFL